MPTLNWIMNLSASLRRSGPAAERLTAWQPRQTAFFVNVEVEMSTPFVSPPANESANKRLAADCAAGLVSLGGDVLPTSRKCLGWRRLLLRRLLDDQPELSFQQRPLVPVNRALDPVMRLPPTSGSKRTMT